MIIDVRQRKTSSMGQTNLGPGPPSRGKSGNKKYSSSGGGEVKKGSKNLVRSVERNRGRDEWRGESMISLQAIPYAEKGKEGNLHLRKKGSRALARKIRK